MKLTAYCTVFLMAALFVVGPHFSLEGKHHHRHRHNHFSLNVANFSPAYTRSYVVEREPAYVEEHIYRSPYGYPYEENVRRIYHPSRRVVYEDTYVAPRPIFTGFSFGVNFR
jgi:hypothetical protein